MGWPQRLAGWAYEANGLKSLVHKWVKNIKPNPTYFKGWIINLTSKAQFDGSNSRISYSISFVASIIQ